MKRILITGASGFIGQAVRTACAARGIEALPLARAAPIAADALRGADALIHLAGIAHRSATPAQYQTVNVDLTEQWARAADAAGVRFVFASSVKAVGEETRDAPWTESASPHPRTDYGRSKLAAEQRLTQIPNLNAVALRLPLVHAPDARANFAALLRLAATPAPLPFADIANRRSLISRDAAVEALLAAARSQTTGVFFVADRPALSTAAILRALREGMGRAGALFPLGPARNLLAFGAARTLLQSLEVDDSAFRAAIGYGPSTPAESADALRETARTWRARGAAR